jgi:hypothetical protein
LRISEYRLGLIILLVRPQEDRRRVPDAYHDIIAAMSGALYDTVSWPETAANGDSTGQTKKPPRGKT